MAIKRCQGRLHELDRPVLTWFEHYVTESHLRSMPILSAHLGAVETLPPVHGDPFDCLLVAQARFDRCVLVTADDLFTGYDVPILW